MEIKTQDDYPLGVVISALRKEIRRGNEEMAMYWCYELIPTFEKYLWRRLVVIVNEDIGIANTELLMLVPIQEK
jgi:replication-associated recombination protein RarA